MPTRGSPRVFAACHVLHRLLAPRHPPNALLTLDQLAHGQTPPIPSRTNNIHPCSKMLVIRSREHPDAIQPQAEARNRTTTRAFPSRHLFTMSRNKPHQPKPANRNLPSSDLMQTNGHRPRLSTFASQTSDAAGFLRLRRPSRAMRGTLRGILRLPEPPCPPSAVPPADFCSSAAKMVGQGRLELPTSRLSSARSNQLSY